MTNEQAINLILQKSKRAGQAEVLAATYAMDDIIDADIDTWLSTNVSEYLMQFPETAESLVDDLLADGEISKKQLANSLTNVSVSMYHYVKFHELLTAHDISLSER